MVDFCLQKQEPYRMRLTVGGNLIQYDGDLSTQTAELTMTKLLFNSVVSTERATFATADIGNFYLGTPMDVYEYMFLPINVIPDKIVQQYNLQKIATNGKVYCEIRKGMYGLPQAGILANKKLEHDIAPYGYYPCSNVPGLWKHKWQSTTFTLVIDNFGIKYVGNENLDHLINALKNLYAKVTVNEDGDLYCGITLRWDYTTPTH